MSHTFSSLFTHIIFSTKDRQAVLTADLRPELLAYMGGIARNIHARLIDSNARPDHVHLLLSLPPSLAVAEAVRVIKANSSLWVHESRRRAAFAWRTGYGAFSVSRSQVQGVVNYIREQEQHHRRISFQEEYVTFLKRHGIAYDERYIWE